METKILEIRDDGTLIPVIAIKMASEKPEEEYLLKRGGFYDQPPGEESVVVVAMPRMEASYSPYKWNTESRTFKVAHLYIKDRFSELKSGDVIDVEFILGETEQPKVSCRLTSA